jgi:hypothetical protein
MKRAFIVAWSLLRLAEFREGRNGMLYVVRFLATMVEATVAGSDLSAFDMSTWDGCALADLNHLFLRQRLTAGHSHHTQGPASNQYAWYIYRTWPSTVRL